MKKIKSDFMYRIEDEIGLNRKERDILARKIDTFTKNYERQMRFINMPVNTRQNNHITKVTARNTRGV